MELSVLKGECDNALFIDEKTIIHFHSKKNAELVRRIMLKDNNFGTASYVFTGEDWEKFNTEITEKLSDRIDQLQKSVESCEEQISAVVAKLKLNLLDYDLIEQLCELNSLREINRKALRRLLDDKIAYES